MTDFFTWDQKSEMKWIGSREYPLSVYFRETYRKPSALGPVKLMVEQSVAEDGIEYAPLLETFHYLPGPGIEWPFPWSPLFGQFTVVFHLGNGGVTEVMEARMANAMSRQAEWVSLTNRCAVESYNGTIWFPSWRSKKTAVNGEYPGFTKNRFVGATSEEVIKWRDKLTDKRKRTKNVPNANASGYFIEPRIATVRDSFTTFFPVSDDPWADEASLRSREFWEKTMLNARQKLEEERKAIEHLRSAASAAGLSLVEYVAVLRGVRNDPRHVDGQTRAFSLEEE